MPIYVYTAKDTKKSCTYCSSEFEVRQNIKDKPLAYCPQCNGAVRKVFLPFTQGFSRSGHDRRAKDCGFHKLKKVDKGKYEKLY